MEVFYMASVDNHLLPVVKYVSELTIVNRSSDFCI